jgi:hypothetical protein
MESDAQTLLELVSWAAWIISATPSGSGEAGARVDDGKKVGWFESGNRRHCDRLEP